MDKETENKEVKSKERPSFGEKMQGEGTQRPIFLMKMGYMGQLMGDYDNYEASIAKHKEVDDKLGGMFESNPQFARNVPFCLKWRP